MSTSASTGAHFWQALAAVMGAAPEHPDTPQPVSPEPATTPSGLWTWLATQVDPNNYRPARLPGIEASRLEGREGVQYVIKNPAAGTYLQLTAADWALWRLMDGVHTVRDLVVEHFVRNRQFAYGRVLSLVRALREQRFLADQPVRVYDAVAVELDRREPGFWGRRLARAFVESQYRLNGLDGYFTRLYGVLRWLFWWPVQALLALMGLAGLAAYADLYLRGTPLVNLQGNYAAGALVLVLANFLVLIFHEHAHALATKHFRREVRRGGFMLYYGFPAFFVDTMDIWLERRGPRIVVTAAGPYTNLLVGGACSLLALAVGGLGGDLLFKVATVAYFGAVVNLNPLLELDGYFILIDWLEMPMLRQRSVEAVRALAANVLGGWLGRARSASAALLPDSREGRIVLTYGVLTLAYSVYVLWLALVFWQTRLWAVLNGMWTGASDGMRAGLVVLLLAAAIPLGWSLAVWLWRGVEGALEWLELRGFFDHNGNLAAIVAAFVVLAVGTVLFVPGPLAPGLSPADAFAPATLFAAAALACVATSRQYQGSRFQAVWHSLAISAGLLAYGALYQPSFVNPFWVLAVFLAPLGWVAAGLFSIAEHDLRHTVRWERAAMIALLVTAPALALPWLQAFPGDAVRTFVVLFGAYGAPLGLALLVPTIAGFAGTRFSVPWVTLALAMVATGLLPAAGRLLQTGASADVAYMPAGVYSLTAALWAAGALCAFIIGRRVQFPHGTLPEQPALSDADRLRSGFARLIGTLFGGFTTAFGRRFAADVDDVLDILSVTADWDVEIDNGRVNDELDLAQMDVIAQGDRYREVLDAVIAQMTERAGHAFVARAFAAAYDSLPWPEREALARYVLAGAPWGRELARSFSSGRSDRLLVLRGVPFFAGLNDAQFRTLLAALDEVRVATGAVVARQGQPAERLYLVASGEIEAWARTTGGERLVGELRRGAVFGKQTLRSGGGIYSATYRASLGTHLFVLTRADLQPLLHEDALLDQRMQSRVEELILLGRMPLFAGLGPQALAELYARMGRRRAAPGEPIIREGETRSSLFIILSGQAEVLARDAQGVEHITGRLGTGEHFGENALFTDSVYGATVRAAPEPADGVDLLTLDETTFDRLVASSAELASYVEQVASGRKIATSRRLAQPARTG